MDSAVLHQVWGKTKKKALKLLELPRIQKFKKKNNKINKRHHSLVKAKEKPKTCGCIDRCSHFSVYSTHKAT